MTTARNKFDTQPLEEPDFGEEAELTAQRVVPLVNDQVKLVEDRGGWFQLSKWSSLLVVLFALSAGLVAGLVIGFHGGSDTSQPSESSAEAHPEPPPMVAAEPTAKDIARTAVAPAEPEREERPAIKAETPIVVERKENVREIEVTRPTAREPRVRENTEERTSIKRAEYAKPSQRNESVEDSSAERRAQRREERRRERGEKRADRPRRVFENDIERIQDIFTGPRYRP